MCITFLENFFGKNLYRQSFDFARDAFGGISRAHPPVGGFAFKNPLPSLKLRRTSRFLIFSDTVRPRSDRPSFLFDSLRETNIKWNHLTMVPFYILRPRQESNPHQLLRRELLCPLSYGGNFEMYLTMSAQSAVIIHFARTFFERKLNE